MTRRGGAGFSLTVAAGLIVVHVALAALVIPPLLRKERAQLEAARLDELALRTRWGAAILRPTLVGVDAALDRDQAIALIEDATGATVTLMAADGALLHGTPSGAAGLRVQPDIERALATGQGTLAVRRPSSWGDPALHAARRIDAAGGPRAVVRLTRSMAPVEAAVNEMLHGLIVVAAASLAASLTVGLFFTARLRGMLRRLIDDTERLASGELDHRISPAPAGGVITELAHGVERLARHLRSRIDQLQIQRREQRAVLESMSSGVLALDLEQRVLTVNRAVETMLGIDGATARGRLLQELVREPALNGFVERASKEPTRIAEELELATPRPRTISAVAEVLLGPTGERVGTVILLDDVTTLRRLETIRTDFAANVSHELRTPITNIKGYIETLEEVEDPAQRARFLDVVRHNATRLEAIVEDLLALARIEQGGPDDTRKAETVALRSVVANAVELFEDAAEAKGIELSWTADESLLVLGSATLLEQAVANLVSNAIKYSPEGTPVAVVARRDHTSPKTTGVIEVSDAGPGIALVHQPRIFERFYRVDSARSRALGGTGLGLSIVKHVAIVHGGRAEVDSTPGRGSTFRIVLPLV